MVINRRAITTSLLFTAALWVVNVVWLLQDSRPPAWDMALHQTYALNYYPGAGSSDPPLPFWQLSGHYPPFVHLVIAVLFWLLHPGAHIAVLANLPATLLLFWALYELASELAGDRAARWTCALAALTPLLIWLSRETILDYWLSAWVAASLVALRRTRGFASHRAALLFGLTVGMGLLTKWLFAGFLAIPVLYVCVQTRIWKEPRRIVHLADALIVGQGIAALWYLPNLPSLVSYFFENAQIGALEGEPPVISFQSLIYYLRLLEGYQLFGLLFGVLAVALIAPSTRKLLREHTFLPVAIAGGWLAMTLLRTKDPRFTTPLLGLLLIFPATWLASTGRGTRATVGKGALIALLVLQAYAINFGIGWLPQKVVVLKGYTGSLDWDWNLYMQEFYGIFGRPRREDWKQDQIFRRILQETPNRVTPARVAVVPDLPQFNSQSLTWRARLLDLPIRIDRPRQTPGGSSPFEAFDFVLMSDGDQGEPWSTTENAALNRIIVDDARTFRLLEMYSLPNGDNVRLYAIQLSRRTAVERHPGVRPRCGVQVRQARVLCRGLHASI